MIGIGLRGNEEGLSVDDRYSVTVRWERNLCEISYRSKPNCRIVACFDSSVDINKLDVCTFVRYARQCFWDRE